MGITIIGCGKAVPRQVVTNENLSRFIDTSDQWIVERTGIKSRRVARNETSTDLGAAAACEALGWGHSALPSIESAGWQSFSDAINPATIDLIVCSTFTPDMLIPSQAALIRQALNLNNAVCFDINAACSGCVYGLEVAESMLVSSAAGKGNPIKRALVIGAERLSRVLDWNDRSTCVLFGDGAGAILLEWNENRPGILASFLKNITDETGALTTGNVYDLRTLPFLDETLLPNDRHCAVQFPASLSETFPFPAPEIATNEDSPHDSPEPHRSAPYHDKSQFYGSHFVEMDGRTVYKFATDAIGEALNATLQRAQLSVDDLALIVPHQANERIIRYAAKKLKKPLEIFQVSIENAGNTSSASLFMALCDAYRANRIQRDDAVALVGFGGGLTFGAIVFRSE